MDFIPFWFQPYKEEVIYPCTFIMIGQQCLKCLLWDVSEIPSTPELWIIRYYIHVLTSMPSLWWYVMICQMKYPLWCFIIWPLASLPRLWPWEAAQWLGGCHNCMFTVKKIEKSRLSNLSQCSLMMFDALLIFLSCWYMLIHVSWK